MQQLPITNAEIESRIIKLSLQAGNKRLVVEFDFNGKITKTESLIIGIRYNNSIKVELCMCVCVCLGCLVGPPFPNTLFKKFSTASVCNLYGRLKLLSKLVYFIFEIYRN